jgi:hypothetical protein
MKVDICNNGPVTILLDSQNRDMGLFSPRQFVFNQMIFAFFCLILEGSQSEAAAE